MAELARAHGIKVVPASITPTSAYHPPANGGAPQTTVRPMARIKAINEWMQKYAAENGHVYLDYFTPMLDSTGVMKAELTGDDLHPNAAGYAGAPVMWSAMLGAAATGRLARRAALWWRHPRRRRAGVAARRE